MRCFFLLLFLVFPVSGIAANPSSDQPATIASLAREVQQLRAENEKLSARISAIEKRFPSQQQTVGITSSFGKPPIGAPPSTNPGSKP